MDIKIMFQKPRRKQENIFMVCRIFNSICGYSFINIKLMINVDCVIYSSGVELLISRVYSVSQNPVVAINPVLTISVSQL